MKDVSDQMMKGQIDNPKEAITPFRLAKKKKDDRLREPYRPKGDWVFYRKSSTNNPQAYYLNKNGEHDACNQVCIGIYTDFKAICAIRVTYPHWRSEYKTFDNLCYMELANCQNKTKRFGWFAVRKGNCSEQITSLGTDRNKIVSRKIEWEKKYLE